MTAALEVAEWLISTIRANGPRRTYQQRLVRQIREDFGEEFSYKNHNGNWAIDKAVLQSFSKLKDDHVFWDRSDQSWRIVDDDQLAALQERAEKRAARKAEQVERRRVYDEQRAQK